MGLIKKVFGAVFGVFGAILKGVLGIFGIGKSDYYLELDESQESSSQGTKPASTQQQPKPSASEQPAAPAQTSKEQPTKPEPAAASQATANQPASGAGAQAPSAAKPTGSPLSQPSGMAVASAKADSESAGTFATDYLVNPAISNGSRRRPGPSLSAFKGMARQMQS
ncbi:hypothetical protein C7271_11805 [filamentous cyanobacterium CCP5]|nr:hypothetical protein C7271_11805 [filamentous cyanobacterium CCP5]